MKLPPETHGPTVFERAAAYLAKMDPSISGQRGHDKLFYVACRMVHGFDLSIDQACVLILSDYNPRCVPPWTAEEIRYKCEQVRKVQSHEHPRGHLLNHEPPASGDQPFKSASHTESPNSNPSGKSQLVHAEDVLNEAAMAIGRRDCEVIFDCGWDLHGIEIGPGKITIVGAPPGTGKTSLASQIMFSALASHQDLCCVVANAEMSPRTLMNREIARVSHVSYQKVRFGTFTDREEETLFKAITALQPLVRRIQLMQPPYGITNLFDSLPATPGLVVIDYLQKFRAAGLDALEGLEAVMGWMRMMAISGWAVLALSSTARQQGGKDGKHSAKGLDMGSFRGSGEIEFQADSAYVLRDLSEEGTTGDRSMLLDCVKNRHGERKSIELKFVVQEMRFEAVVKKHDFGGGYGDEDF